ncbi:MAG TPA: radical SAM protein [Candidatus Methylomirabilis sp.]|nr:radical SAM protein [Candidatus Methylomirabilis sp.]
MKQSACLRRDAFRILLVSPVDKAVLGQDFYFRFPHLSLPTLAAYTPEGAAVEIADEKFHPLPDAKGYDLVGITAMTPLAPRAYRIADTFRKQGVPVVMGGYHPTVMPDEALQHADSLCIGEAETLWPVIVADAMAGRLKARYDSGAFPCLENLPRPRRDLLQVPRSRRFEHINLYFLQTTRGCPFRCSFCAVTSVLGGKLRHRPVAEIEAELESLGIRRLDRGQKRDRFHNIVFFTDDNIAGHRSYAKQLLRMVASFNLKWVGQASTNVADDEEILSLLRESGCMGLAVGFETLSQKNIRDVGKGVNRTQEYLDRIGTIHSYGIGLAGNFIFGFDHDNETTFAEVVNFVDRARLEGFYYSLLTPYPGTPFFEQMKTENRILETDWSLYDTDHVVYRPRLMDAETLMKGYRWAWRRSLTYRSILKRLLGSRNQLIFFGPMNYGMRQTILAHR